MRYLFGWLLVLLGRCPKCGARWNRAIDGRWASSVLGQSAETWMCVCGYWRTKWPNGLTVEAE